MRFAISEPVLELCVNAKIGVGSAQGADSVANFGIWTHFHDERAGVEPGRVVVDVAHVDGDFARVNGVAIAIDGGDADFVKFLDLPTLGMPTSIKLVG